MSTAPQTDQNANLWAEYERRKQALSPDLSPSERDAEIKRIADELGI